MSSLVWWSRSGPWGNCQKVGEMSILLTMDDGVTWREEENYYVDWSCHPPSTQPPQKTFLHIPLPPLHSSPHSSYHIASSLAWFFNFFLWKRVKIVQPIISYHQRSHHIILPLIWPASSVSFSGECFVTVLALGFFPELFWLPNRPSNWEAVTWSSVIISIISPRSRSEQPT